MSQKANIITFISREHDVQSIFKVELAPRLLQDCSWEDNETLLYRTSDEDQGSDQNVSGTQSADVKEVSKPMKKRKARGTRKAEPKKSKTIQTEIVFSPLNPELEESDHEVTEVVDLSHLIDEFAEVADEEEELPDGCTAKLVIPQDNMQEYFLSILRDAVPNFDTLVDNAAFNFTPAAAGGATYLRHAPPAAE